MTASSEARQVRATIDTNLFVSAAIRREGIPAAILRAWQRDASVVVTSTELVREIAQVYQRPALLQRFRIPEPERSELLNQVLATEHVDPLYPLQLAVRDPKDAPLLACALGGLVDYLVTGDIDLLALAGDTAIGQLRIVTPREFLNRLSPPA